ncbi:MAG: hypothetical protein ACE5H4_14605 [Candidatus Thorarchaeota archaeon]
MSIEESLERIEQIVKEGYSEEKWKALEEALLSFVRPPGHYPPHDSRPTDEQFSRFIDVGVALFEQGYPQLIDGIPTISFFGGGLEMNEFDTDNSLPQSLHVTRRFIERHLRPSEEIVLMEYGGCEMGSFNRLKSGHIAITNDRILAIGHEVIGSTKVADRHYLIYPDLKEKAYYQSLDFLPLDKVKKVKVNWGLTKKNVSVTLRDIEYVKISPRHFYGPLFFKMQLSDKVKSKVGDFTIRIRLARWPESQSSQHHKQRHKRLSSTIEDLTWRSRTGKSPPTPK